LVVTLNTTPSPAGADASAPPVLTWESAIALVGSLTISMRPCRDDAMSAPRSM
jgi:hypothetical protein